MKNKKNWLQILAWSLCVILAIGLIYLVRDDKRKKAERYVQLQLQANELEQVDSEKLEALTEVYDRFYSQLELKSIVCWGDAAMAGNKDLSLPLTLGTVIDDNLFSSINKTFSSVLEQEEYTTPSIVVNNMGVTNEDMRLIKIRAGVNDMEVGDWIQIPSDSEPVTVRLMDDEAWESDLKDDQLHFAKQSADKFGKVWISDVEGSLVATDDWFDSNHPRYAFVRNEEGDRTSASSGTNIEIESATKYLGDIPVFFFENSSGRSVEGFVSDIEELVDRYANLDEENDEEGAYYDIPFVVICTTDEGSELDKALSDAFESHYIRNEYALGSLNARSYKKLAQVVYDKLDEQGCFSDAKARIALAISESESF